MINPFNQHGILMYQNENFFNPVCCICIPSRYGVFLTLAVWIGFSMYFACLSFMQKSPFYSHLTSPALIVFGVVNVLFVIVCIYGLILYFIPLIRVSFNRVRSYSKLIACCVAAVLIDTLINFIIFCVKQDEFNDWCQNRSINDINQTLPENTSTDQLKIAFNCSRLFQAEVKFSITTWILMLLIYTMWASFIKSDSQNFVMVRPEITRAAPILPMQSQPPMMNTNIPTAADAGITLSNIPPSSKRKDRRHDIILL